MNLVTLIPAGARSPRGLGVVVALHGLGGDAEGTASILASAMASAAIPRGQAAGFAVLTVDGGRSYWHRRADGDDPQGMIIHDDPQGMIIHEVLPRAAALGLRTDRIGIVGESMGGYGALLLAERLGASTERLGASTTASPASFAPGAAAVAAISPAIFASYADARRADERSFDGPRDFARNDVLSRLTALRHVPCYVACGESDPFQPTARLLRSRLERLTGQAPPGGIEAGCHDNAFWARNLPGGLTFISAHLP